MYISNPLEFPKAYDILTYTLQWDTFPTDKMNLHTMHVVLCWLSYNTSA